MAEQTTGSGSQATRPRTYTDEYRGQVVDMVASTGRTAMSVAAELGIHHTLISRSIRRYRRTGTVVGTDAAGSADTAAQVRAGSARRPGSRDRAAQTRGGAAANGA